ncbi:MAG: tetratricopeptide repeat protein, partial [Deltaproteobacteria bacterium]|nr:tetratricopeptide repeat protein [Deltaproteobacteria bacterium]
MQRRAAKLSLLLSGTTGLLLMLCSPAAAGEPTTATAGKARSFSLDDVAPVFTGPASTAFREKRHAEAARLFEAFLEEHGDDPRAPRARLLAGLARARSGDGKAAAALLEGLHARLPRTLAPYARILAAEQLLPDTPEKALAELSGLPAGTPLQRKAELLRAQALEAAGKREQAVALLDELIRSGKAGASELKLAARLARDGDRDEQAEQLERKLWIEHPLSEAARGLSEPSRLTADERIRRGQAFYERDRHALALEELERVLVPSTAKAGRCQARFLRGHTHFKSRRYAPAVDELQHYFDEGCPAAGDEVQKARALYYAGRSAARSGRSALAVGFFERLARELPRSNLADDALLLASEVLVDQGQPKKAAAALQKIVEHVAHGDMLEEAWFRLAWARYLKGELKEALKVLTRAATAGVRGTDYYSRGRLLYWRARILGRTGKRDEAIRLYRQIVRKEPLS